MPADNLRFGEMSTCFRRNGREIKDITLDRVVANGNAATSPSRRGVVCKQKQCVLMATKLKIRKYQPNFAENYENDFKNNTSPFSCSMHEF